jgi:hypothetical protein
MRARHGVGHGVDPELGGLGRRRACQSAGLSPRQSASDARRHAARRVHACGYVDNARALPTDPQAQQSTSINLIASEAGGQTQPLSYPRDLKLGNRDASPVSSAIFARISTAIHTYSGMQVPPAIIRSFTHCKFILVVASKISKYKSLYNRLVSKFT